MSELPFIDTHVHFWDLKHPTLRWVWLEPDFVHPLMGDIDGLKRLRFAGADFLAQTRYTEVAKVIHVQAALGSPDPVDETVWLAGAGASTGGPAGHVGEGRLLQ